MAAFIDGGDDWAETPATAPPRRTVAIPNVAIRPRKRVDIVDYAPVV
jgi:hypothetical protein